jgi:hypothetical protein
MWVSFWRGPVILAGGGAVVAGGIAVDEAK